NASPLGGRAEVCVTCKEPGHLPVCCPNMWKVWFTQASCPNLQYCASLGMCGTNVCISC
uniref:CCHC-type domain-containing protein n=1 Tax=Aegilops tauschii subsp. strangulata TaxID=200361 RepID=A0A453QJU0_AEGTS